MKWIFKNSVLARLIPAGLWLLSLPARAGTLQDAGGELRNAAGAAYGESAASYVEGAPLATIVGDIINVILFLVGAVLLILLIYGGYIWMIARGDTEKVKKAKEILTNAVIGILIVFLAYVIANFVVSRLTDITTGASGG